jgi:hypothetical protein
MNNNGAALDRSIATQQNLSGSETAATVNRALGERTPTLSRPYGLAWGAAASIAFLSFVSSSVATLVTAGFSN